MSTCTMPGCDNTTRARGLCSTHYNQQLQPNRHVKVLTSCTYCGESCMKQVANTRRGRFCSLLCRDLWLLEHVTGCYSLNKKPRILKVKAVPISCLLAESACVCGLIFFHRPGPRSYCTKRCANKAKNVGHKERKKIRRVAIFERDSYICWMCEKTCDPSLRVPHPDTPTIDHLVPQSLRGTHDPDNLATACFRCNSTRGASWNIPTCAISPAA